MEFAVHVGFLLTIFYIKLTRATNLDQPDQIEQRIRSKSYPEFLPNYNYDLDPNISGEESFVNSDSQGMICITLPVFRRQKN